MTGLPDFVAYVFVFIFGAIVGSFLNVVIHRVPNEESIVFPNSGCPKCKTPIKGYDNIPVLSWLILRGKCRACSEPISPRYPAVELLTAFVFVLVYWQTGLTPILPVYLAFGAAMIALIFIDAEHMILPNADVRDSAYYSIVDDDWPEVRANLERRLAETRKSAR